LDRLPQSGEIKFEKEKRKEVVQKRRRLVKKTNPQTNRMTILIDYNKFACRWQKSELIGDGMVVLTLTIKLMTRDRHLNSRFQRPLKLEPAWVQFPVMVYAS